MENIGLLFIIKASSPQLFLESVMGNSLHNKIYLGRRSVLASRRLRMVLGMGAAAGVGLALLMFRSMN
jgi:hypothetical protein